MSNSFEFFVDPLAHGRVTPRALLSAEGTISAPFLPELLVQRKHLAIVRLAGEGWFFNVGYTNGGFVIQRNGGQLTLDHEWCVAKGLPDTILASWTMDALILSFGAHSTHWAYPQLTEQCRFTVPPLELVRWVREKELAPIKLFANEEQFLLRMHSSLQRLDERLGAMLSREIFWDVERVGNKVIGRRPKRETDVQSAIHAMLFDHMQLSNVDILPEARSPAGEVDFLLSSALADGTIGKICVEFKNAHSQDLGSGLRTQLRSYMEKLDVRNGAYCVLDYRNGDFNHPPETTVDLIAALHKTDAMKAAWPNRPVKIHWIRLTNGGKEPK